jgi:hypothetical protein
LTQSETCPIAPRKHGYLCLIQANLDSSAPTLLLHTSRTSFAEFLMLPKKLLDTRTRIA